MTPTVSGVLFAVAVLLGAAPFALTARLKRRLARLPQQTPQASDWPRVTLVLPCKGLDPGFDRNMQALIAQDYPDLELVFVVATVDDPAYLPLRDLIERNSMALGAVKGRVLVAGISPLRAQKLTNQLTGVQAADPASTILVFIDSDGRPDPGFVRRLVAPLLDEQAGATTGYRWYHPPEPTAGSILRSTWNAGALPFLVDPKRVFAWGGAMAIRRETFVLAGIAQSWDRAVSDDMTLTVAIRRLGLPLRFVESCIVVSYESSTMAETLEFTNRQSLISRVYFPPLWWGTAIGHSLANLLVIYGLTCLLAGFFTPPMSLGAACALLLPAQMVNAAWLFGSARAMLPEAVRPALTKLRWHYVLAAPVASVMTLVNTVHSIATRKMTWRGIRYELRSPTETVVVAD